MNGTIPPKYAESLGAWGILRRDLRTKDNRTVRDSKDLFSSNPWTAA
jgi:hypothetical protein